METVAGVRMDDARSVRSWTAPFAPSWLDRLIGWIARLPGPVWAAYVVLGLASITLSNAQAWASGQLAVGVFDPALVFWGIFLVALLATVAYLDTVAGAAFDAFRPALDQPEDELRTMRYGLVVLPARPAWLLTIFTVVITPAYYLADPVGAEIVGLDTTGLVLRTISEAFSSAILLLIVYQLIRQMRMVDAIVATAPRVDLFQPGPLYAFSKLTSRTAIALAILIGTSSLVALPDTLNSSALLLWAPWLIGIPAFAVVAFVLPLMGMHGRLVAEKERLQGDVEQRLKVFLVGVNQDVDAGDLARADAQNKTMATLLQQRDLLARLPTWPWSPGTFRTIVTAIFLPLIIFLVQRLLAQVV